MLPKSRLPDSSQGPALATGLPKDERSQACYVNSFLHSPTCFRLADFSDVGAKGWPSLWFGESECVHLACSVASGFLSEEAHASLAGCLTQQGLLLVCCGPSLRAHSWPFIASEILFGSIPSPRLSVARLLHMMGALATWTCSICKYSCAWDGMPGVSSPAPPDPCTFFTGREGLLIQDGGLMSSLEHGENTPALVESFIEDQQCTRQCGRQTCTPSPHHCLEEKEEESLHLSWPFSKRPAGSG